MAFHDREGDDRKLEGVSPNSRKPLCTANVERVFDNIKSLPTKTFAFVTSFNL